jgi:hypothetical protein
VDAEDVFVAAEEFDNGEAEGIGAKGGSRGKYAMRLIIGGRSPDQFEAVRTIKGPYDEEMRKSLDVGQPGLKFGQDLESPLGIVPGSKSFRY